MRKTPPPNPPHVAVPEQPAPVQAPNPEGGPDTAEHRRLREPMGDTHGWKRWGPYVSERAWGTVREDYSANGDPWSYLPHDLARSKAYRWGEDGLAAVCDRYQVLVFALALWNGKDPILKERLFGVVPAEGNHGEDVKEYYFYLDSTPTHSYMRYLYKYPQRAFPYTELVEENRRRGGCGYEYELLDTGIFDDDRYFDVFVEYAKAGPEDLCIRIEAFNRGPEAAPLQLLPHLWFRNSWSWNGAQNSEPVIRRHRCGDGAVCLLADDRDVELVQGLPHDYDLGKRYLYAEAGGTPLFTNNETHAERVYGGAAQSRSPYVKDAFHRHLIHGEACVNPEEEGTKACLHYERLVPPGGSVVLRLRLTDGELPTHLADVDAIVARRKAEADEFYAAIHPPKATEDERNIQRQALAGLLWSKQVYLYDVHAWLSGDNPACPPPAERYEIRNRRWLHLKSMRVLTMPDKWEYPWFAAWDLAFQAITFALVDGEFAKEQLWYLLFEQFQHPSGQIPAYEWEFSDLNPPVHAWAVWRVYNMDRIRSGWADRQWLEKCFHKLLINFAWWVNKVDAQGNNIFEGGFLGLDNITIFDRSGQFDEGVVLEQADATGWVGMFCLNLMRIALELAKENPAYEGLATKFFQHYGYVGAAMKQMGGCSYALWDEEDGFFYDVLRYESGPKQEEFEKLRVRSLVGLIPLYAVERLEVDWIAPFPHFKRDMRWFVTHRPDIAGPTCHHVERPDQDVYVLTIVDPDQTRRMVERLLDPEEFLSPYGIRSLSRYHLEHPYVFDGHEVRYEPAESNSKLKGGNSNWRGPLWFPTTFLMIESLRKLGTAYGPTFTISAPALSDRPLTFREIAAELAERMIRIFTRNERGERPVYGGARKFQDDPHWRDYLLFYEYFHGDNGAGLGASHQTGWTALVASLIDEWRL